LLQPEIHFFMAIKSPPFARWACFAHTACSSQEVAGASAHSLDLSSPHREPRLPGALPSPARSLTGEPYDKDPLGVLHFPRLGLSRRSTCCLSVTNKREPFSPKGTFLSPLSRWCGNFSPVPRASWKLARPFSLSLPCVSGSWPVSSC